MVADGFWPVDAEDTSQAVVDERLGLFGGCHYGSPGFSSVQQSRLHDGVEEADLGLDGYFSRLPDIP